MYAKTRFGFPGLVLMAITAMAVMAGSALSATDGRRVALVIGNGGYSNIPALPNPAKDARLIAEKLRAVGFDVEMAVDGDWSQLQQSVRSFGRRARGADAALFFYAGHGIQSKGENFLLPVDAKVGEVADLRYEALPLSLVTEELDEADAKISMVVLDACRDNPLTRSLRGSGRTRSTDVTQGLATVQSASGMLIAYATAPGDVAYDGDGTENSPFTRAFADWIEKPGLEVALMFRRVREQVYETTGGKQRPWVEEAILGDFYFQPKFAALTPAPEPTAPVAVLPKTLPEPQQQLEQPVLQQRQDDGGDPLTVAWARARSLNTSEAYEQFIALYPDSLYADRAAIFLSQMGQIGTSRREPSAVAPQPQQPIGGTGRNTTIRITEEDDAIPGLY
ncbi:MAG: caspase family protein [Geminicoccaceae bacterium]